jgi:hypothetical protein
MATPLPPLPGETPEQRRARLSAADAVQARIDAQKRAELEAQAEARRKEMQARIDNMLRSAYVLPPLPQLPVGVGSGSGVGPAPVGVGPAPVKTTRPDPNVIQSTIVTADGYVPNPAYTADVAMQRYRAELLNNNYYSPQERQQIMSSIENAYAQPGATGQQVKDAYQNASAAATRARHREQEARNAAYYAQQPPAPLSNLPPDVVAKPIDPYLRELITPVPSPPPIPTYYDPVPPVMPPTMVPPPLQNLGEVLQRIQQKQPQVMPPVDPGFVIGPREPTGPIPTYYDPVPPVEQPTPPTMMMPPVDPGFVIDIPTFRPPMQPPMPVDPGFVMDIPTFQPPMPEIPNVGLIDNRIGPGFGKPMQPTPSPIDNMSSSILDALRQLQPSAPGNTDYGQPAQPSAGMGLSRLAPPEPYTPPVFEPYTPPMAEPYTPPSMQFSVDMPRMDYARDLYGVIPDNVSMLKRGGLAVKPKKGKC